MNNEIASGKERIDATISIDVYYSFDEEGLEWRIFAELVMVNFGEVSSK